MKRLSISLILLFTCKLIFAQEDFTGIIKYKIYTDNNPNTDSMTVIVDKQRVKVILYFAASEAPYIDDLKNRKSISINTEKKTYTVDSLNKIPKYNFINTRKIEASTIQQLCLRYKADSTNFDRSKIIRVDCLGSINYLTNTITDYFFLGIQPIIVDNRIVMEFVTTNADGSKSITSVTSITKLENTDKYFDLKKYTEEK